MKKGFGLLEVIVASVVLGFLIVGLNTLQKGNRESLLRVRARDAANFVAQHVLDSLGSVGINSLVESNGVVYEKEYVYNFEGKPQLDKNAAGTKVPVKYGVKVTLLAAKPGDVKSSVDTTSFTKAVNSNATATNTFAKGLEATVSWEFKKSKQSITMAKVAR